MKPRDWNERKRLRRQRAESGHTSLRVSNLTTEILAKLRARFPMLADSYDELLYELGRELLEEDHKT